MSSEFSKDSRNLLARQLRRSDVDVASLDPATQKLLEAVDGAYRDFEANRDLLERSLTPSSKEMRQTNAELRALLSERDAADAGIARAALGSGGAAGRSIGALPARTLLISFGVS